MSAIHYFSSVFGSKFRITTLSARRIQPSRSAAILSCLALVPPVLEPQALGSSLEHEVSGSASVETSPTGIVTVRAPEMVAGASSHTVYRKSSGANSWDAGTAPPASAQSIVDMNSIVGSNLSLPDTPRTEWYVSTQGSDSNPGTAAQPFRTIGRACRLAGPGVTIHVLPGVYTDYSNGWGLRLSASGSAANPIVLRSEIKGGAVIDGQNATNRNVGIYLEGSYNTVDGFEIRGGPNGGITIRGNSNQIINNEIHDNGNPASSSTNGRDGVYSNEGTRNNVYLANYIHDNGRPGSNLDHGLYLCGVNEVVLNNMLVRNAASGLQIAGYTTVSSMKVYNNVMAFNGTCGIVLWQALSGVDIKNNIVYQNGRYGIGSWDAHGSGVVLDHNLCFGNRYGDYNFTDGGSDYSYTRGTTISVAPLFLNPSPAGFDAHLAAASPAINAGLNLSSFFTGDKDGAGRPAAGAWDLGVYEYAYTDTTGLVVSLSAPTNNATVSGASVMVSADASAVVGVAGVQFKLDGANLRVEDTDAPYRVTWNTTTVANGSHTLSAVVRDAAGNQARARAVSIVVSNSNTAPVISSIPDQTVNAGTATAPLPFTVSDAETAAGDLIVSGSSSNPTLIPNANIVFGGSGTNRSVTVGPAANQSGTATVTITISDGSASTSESFLLTVIPATTSKYLYLPFEAESAVLAAPMAVASDTNASLGRFVQTSAADSGSATFPVNIPVTDVYFIWCRVFSPDYDHNSFYFSVDGGMEDIYDTAQGTWKNAWQWTVVNGRGGTNSTTALAINPRTFLLSAGLHSMVLRGREAGTGLDQILVTNDPKYVPEGTFSIAGMPVRISSVTLGPGGFVTFTWPAMAGKTYRVACKNGVSDTNWTDLSGDINGTNASTSWTDGTGSKFAQRYYTVYVTN